MTTELIDKLEAFLCGMAAPVGQALAAAYNNPLETAKAVSTSTWGFISSHPAVCTLTVVGGGATYLAYQKGVFNKLPKPWDWQIANGRINAEVDTVVGGAKFNIGGWIAKKPAYF